MRDFDVEACWQSRHVRSSNSIQSQSIGNACQVSTSDEYSMILYGVVLYGVVWLNFAKIVILKYTLVKYRAVTRGESIPTTIQNKTMILNPANVNRNLEWSCFVAATPSLLWPNSHLENNILRKGVPPPMMLQLWKRWGSTALAFKKRCQKRTTTRLRWSIAGEKSPLANSIQMQAGTIWGNLQTGFGEFFNFWWWKMPPSSPLLSPVYFVTKILKCRFFAWRKNCASLFTWSEFV